MGKEADLLKAAKNNDKSKLQKLFLPEGDFKVQKADSPAGGIRLQLKHINVDCHEPESGYTPLILAILHGHKDVVESLIFHNADVNATDSKGNTALHIAVFSDRNDMVEILLKNKALVNISNIDGNNSLHIACQNSSAPNVPLVLKLLKADCDVEQKNRQGLLPLDLAAMFNRKDAVSAILDHLPATRQNLSAIVHAATRGHYKIVELLLNYGVNPNGIDPLKQTGPLHEAVRFCRLNVAKILLEFGARKDLVSGTVQSPEMIAKGLPYNKASEFLSLFKECVEKTPKVPKYLADVKDASAFIKPDYPLLPLCSSWTENIPSFCNSCTANNPNTNLLDGNLCSFWVIPSKHNAWTAFDMGTSHTISGIRIWGWNSSQMVKKLEIQKAERLEGPWSSIATIICKQDGSERPTDPGSPQDFHSFTDRSQYWRIVVQENYGGNCICFQGVQFYGADDRVSELLKKHKLSSATDDIIKMGYNTLEKFVFVEPSLLRDMVPDKAKHNELTKEMKDIRLKFHPITSLSWLATPGMTATEDCPFQDFSVQSEPEVCEEVELIVEDSDVKGQTRVPLDPSGSNQASIAKFSNIVFTKRPKPKSETELAAAFDDIEAMLQEAQLSLDSPEEEVFNVPDIKWL